MSTPVLLSCIAAGIVLLIVLAIFIKPVKTLFSLVMHSAVGWAALYIFNKIFAFSAFFIGINIASATIAGILGLPGILLLALVKLIYN